MTFKRFKLYSLVDEKSNTATPSMNTGFVAEFVTMGVMECSRLSVSSQRMYV